VRVNIKEQVQLATDEMHDQMKKALEAFTDKTGLKITTTRWDAAEVLMEGSVIGVKYLRLRSSMETKQT
jgi:hypothetical protein